MSLFVNASPQFINLGVNDMSGSIVTPEPVEIPQHLPKAYFYARKGTTIPTPTIGGPMLVMYGAETFDKDNVYYNHSTRFITGFTGAANTVMLQRVIPDDANPESNITIYLDVLATDVPNYVRNSDGSYVIDPATNDYKVDTDNPTISGYKYKIIEEYVPEGIEPGSATMKTGTMVDADGNTSTMYPIIDLKAKYRGEFYNNIGIGIGSMSDDEVQREIIEATKSLPYKLELVSRENTDSKYVVKPSLYGEPNVQFTFKEGAINPLTKSRFDLETVFTQNWYNETDPLLPLDYDEFEKIYVYTTSLDTVLAMLLEKEAPYVTNNPTTWDDGNEAATSAWFDYLTADEELTADEKYIFNFLNGKSTKGVNYFTFVRSDDTPVTTPEQQEITMSLTTPVFLKGGSDGSLTPEMFNTLVERELAKYLDSDSEVMDNAINVESVMYDSGFPLNTKEELCNFIAVRKDTAVALSTHDASLGEKFLPLSDERAIAVALKNRLKLTPESDYFGTSVARGIVVAGTGLLADNSTKDRIPLLYSIGVKSAKFMGAGDGKWNGVYAFDRAPGNIITELVSIEPSFIPAGIKPTLWNDGIVWAQPYDRRQYHFPAVQTVYDDDTSVLNSWFTVIAVCTVTKIADNAWRNFTGATDLTEAQLSEAIVAYVNKATKNIFDGRIVVVPEVVFTEADKQRGYSWKMINRLYANNMKTVAVYETAVYRMSDLES